MKRWTAIVLSCLLAFCLCSPAFSAAGFAVPGVALLTRTEGPDDVLFSFSLSSPDGAAYENNRRALYEEMHKGFTDEEIALAGEDWLLHPLLVLVEAEVGGKLASVKLIPPEETGFSVSLTRDVLPALVKFGLYTHDSFLYTLRFSLALDLGQTLLPVSSDTAAGPYVCPETGYIDYDLPAGTDNPNPVFPFLPNAGFMLENPTHEGYIFDGWLKDGAPVDRVPAGETDYALSSAWTPREWGVRYVLPTREGPFIFVNNTDNPERRVYGTETRLYALVPPSGWLLAGWYLTPDFSGREVTAIPADTLGDVILYAKWLTPQEKRDESIRRAHWGDLDSDGKVTAADARLALRSAVDLEHLDPRLILRADFAGKGRLAAEDARTLLRISVELDTLEEVLLAYGRIKGDD